ncbi:MAG TPA: hypothetical protein VGR16_01610, partial [Thermomicrobiales bacterium]|nr:hypothetical protein [Thermomicrobiales bacterium]
RNRLTRNDAPLSVLRAYTPDELGGLLRRAGIDDARISTHLWFRMAAVYTFSPPPPPIIQSDRQHPPDGCATACNESPRAAQAEHRMSAARPASPGDPSSLRSLGMTAGGWFRMAAVRMAANHNG